MLFNSFEFIFAFLPVVVLLVWAFGRFASFQAVVAVLVAASLFFYGWWNPVYLLIIVLSMVINYQLGKRLSKRKEKPLLYVGVLLNLFSLGYFKYTDFVLDNVNLLLESPIPLPNVVLPLAISFFTFQQVAYLVDSFRGETVEKHPLDYALFVTFFPQLIAGPIVHHKEMLPQFAKGHASITAKNMGIGLSIFAMGLFKKAVIADGIAGYANTAFVTVDTGGTLDFFAAWGGALAYTFQLYFDFSGYSDMAIGLARMFGIVLPLNFYSPYKAVNISEFWRRWHMTLSRFLRDYLYIALGGNRNGNVNRYRNLFLTMVLGGIWHGAGWNFLIWGVLHGSYLMVFHGWRNLCPTLHASKHIAAMGLGWVVTFLAAVVSWVFFRATTFDGAVTMLKGMVGQYGISIPQGIWSRLGTSITSLLDAVGMTASSASSSAFVSVWIWNVCLLVAVLVLPNTQDMFSRSNGSLSNLSFSKHDAFWPGHKWVSRFTWQTTTGWALWMALLFVAGVMTLSQVSEFLYFQF